MQGLHIQTVTGTTTTTGKVNNLHHEGTAIFVENLDIGNGNALIKAKAKSTIWRKQPLATHHLTTTTTWN